MFGLDRDTLHKIRACFAQFPQIHKVLLYGSRAMGTQHTGSDVDISLIGQDLSRKNTLHPLSEALDELLLPFTFDVSIFTQLKKPELIQHILERGVCLYQAEVVLKEGWELKTLREICEKTSNIKWSSHPKQEYRYIDLSSVSRDTLTINNADTINCGNAPSRAKKIVAKGDVIFATTRPTLTRTTIIEENYDGQICSTGFTVIRGNPDKIHTRYIFYFFQTTDFYVRVESLQRGASYPAVTDQDVKGATIPVPPLAEQEAIVALLDKAFAAIDQAKANLETNIANAKELFQSKLNDIFAQKGDGWVETKLGELAIFSQGVQVGLKEQLTAPKNGYIRFIRIVDYTQNTSDIRYVKDPGSKHHITADDIVMVRYGSPGLIGRGKEGIIANNLFKITITDKGLTNNYAVRFLEQSKIRSYLGSQGASTMPALSFGHLRTVDIQYPSDTKTQLNITSEISTAEEHLETLTRHYQTKLASLDELKKSLLQKAFNGELTDAERLSA